MRLLNFNSTDFWRTIDELSLLHGHRTICFLSLIIKNCIITGKNNNKIEEKSNVKC